MGVFNLRIMISWIDLFKEIFKISKKYFFSSKYYQNIVDDFLKYSIWEWISYTRTDTVDKLGKRKDRYPYRNHAGRMDRPEGQMCHYRCQW